MFFPSIRSLIYYFLQIITELYLYDNKIGDQGAEYLACALQQNKVELFL